MCIKIIKMEYSWKYHSCWPYNGIVNDLWRGVQAEQNYLVALGLFAYSEVLGRRILGTIGQSGGGTEAFREFTEKYVGYSFSDDAEWRMVFNKYRNGLAHEFYIKQPGSGVYNDDGSAKCGIDISGAHFILKIHSYFLHFVRGIESALDQGKLLQ